MQSLTAMEQVSFVVVYAEALQETREKAFDMEDEQVRTVKGDSLCVSWHAWWLCCGIFCCGSEAVKRRQLLHGGGSCGKVAAGYLG